MVGRTQRGRGRSWWGGEGSSSETNSCRGTAVIAASRPPSAMPRRRNFFSIISKHCAAYSFFSSMRDRRCMFFPRSCFQYLFHLRQCEIAFLIAIVEVRRKAYTSFGTVVNKDVPGEEFAAYLIRVRTFHRNCPRALFWFFRCVHPPAASPGPFDEHRRHTLRFFANCRNANLVKN